METIGFDAEIKTHKLKTEASGDKTGIITLEYNASDETVVTAINKLHVPQTMVGVAMTLVRLEIVQRGYDPNRTEGCEE